MILMEINSKVANSAWHQSFIKMKWLSWGLAQINMAILSRPTTYHLAYNYISHTQIPLGKESHTQIPSAITQYREN